MISNRNTAEQSIAEHGAWQRAQQGNAKTTERCRAHQGRVEWSRAEHTTAKQVRADCRAGQGREEQHTAECTTGQCGQQNRTEQKNKREGQQNSLGRSRTESTAGRSGLQRREEQVPTEQILIKRKQQKNNRTECGKAEPSNAESLVGQSGLQRRAEQRSRQSIAEQKRTEQNGAEKE